MRAGVWAIAAMHYQEIEGGYLGMDPGQYPMRFEENEFDRKVKQLIKDLLGIDVAFATCLS